MRPAFFLSFLCISNLVHAQVNRTVIDKATGAPIPYATIKVLHKPKGIIASEKGEFILPIEKDDSVLVSSVGYYQSVFTGAAYTIALEPKKQMLRDVVIGKRKFLKTILIGSTAKKEENDKNWGPTFNKEEFAQLMELPDSQHAYQLKKIYIPVEKYIDWGPLILRIYTVDATRGIPGELIFQKLIPLNTGDIKKKIASIDISKEDIWLYSTRTFFIALTWPGNAYHDHGITTIMLARNSHERTYTRSLHGERYEWSVFGAFKSKEGQEFTVATIFSAELDELKIEN